MKSDFTQKIVLKTKFGHFLIRDICWDIKSASPSFERVDLEELMRRIDDSLHSGKNVLFLDIGAQFGKYTVAIGNRFKKYGKKLKIFSFEPDPECFQLLQKNIRLNSLRNVMAFQTALSDKKTMQRFYYYKPQRMIVSFPTTQRIKVHTTTLDSYSTYFPKAENSDLFIKLDVEGHEIEALKGGRRIIKKAKKAIVLIEDFSPNSKKLMRYLSSHGTRLSKNSPMNSFWQL